MKKIIISVGAVVVIGVAYWLISPLFIDKEVQETLDPNTEEAIQKAVEEFKEKKADTNLDEQLSEEKQEKMFKEMAVTEDKKMEEPMPEAKEEETTNTNNEVEQQDNEDKSVEEPKSTEPKIISFGEFVTVAHQGSGEAKVIDLGANGKILRFENFKVDNGPDLRVLLSKNSNVTSASNLGSKIELGKLKGNIGTQNYVIPNDININEYNSVIIYCKPFQVVFNSANLISQN